MGREFAVTVLILRFFYPIKADMCANRAKL